MSNAFKVGAISASITLDNNPFKQGIRDSIKESMSLRGAFTAMRQDIADVARDFTIAGAAITGFFASTVKAAANVEEAENLFNVSMGSMADATREWSESLADQLQLNANTVRELVGEINLLPKAMGFTEQASAHMSKELTKLAVDMSSFRNIPIAEAMNKLRAGLRGEAEPMSDFGVLLDENSLKAFAFSNGIGKVGEDLTALQKIISRYGIMLRDTKDAQGDMARTMGSGANQFRQLSEQVLAVGQAIGDHLLGPVTQAVGRVNEAIRAVKGWAKDNADLAQSMTRITAGTGLATLGIGSMAIGVLGLARAFDVLKKAAAISWAVVLAPEALVVAALAAVGAGVYALRAIWNDSYTSMSWGARRALDEVMEKFTALKDWATGIAASIASPFIWAFNSISGAASDMLAKVGIDTAAIGSKVGDAFSGAGSWMGGIVDNIKYVGSAMTSGLGDFFGDVGDSVMKQLNKDFELLPNEIQDLVKRLNETMTTPAFEGYNPGDLKGFLDGARSLGDMESAAKKAGDAAKKAAEELKRLKEEASDMRLDLFPKEGFADAAADITKLATLFPEIMTGDAVQRGFQDLFAQFDGQGVTSAQLLEAGLVAVGPKFKDAMIEGWAGAQSVINEEIMNLQTQLDDAAQIDLVGKGVALDMDLSGAGAIKDMIADVTALKEVGKIDASNMNLLSKRYWSQFKDLPEAAIEKIIAQLNEIAPAAGKAFASTVKESAQMKKIDGFNKAASDIAGISSAVGKLGPKFEGAAKAGEIASHAMSLAANVVSGNWAAVAMEIIEIIGLFGDASEEANKELTGMASLINELKEATDDWATAFTDTLVEGFNSGKFAWSDLVNTILNDMQRLAVHELISKPLQNLVIDLGSDILSGFKDGGAFDKGHVVTSPEYFNTKSGPAVRGEAGTEVVMPAVRLGDGTLGVRSAGGGSGLAPIINIQDNRRGNDPPIEVRHQQMPDGQMVYDIVVGAWNKAAVVGDLDRGFLAQMSRML